MDVIVLNIRRNSRKPQLAHNSETSTHSEQVSTKNLSYQVLCCYPFFTYFIFTSVDFRLFYKTTTMKPIPTHPVFSQYHI